MGQDKGLIQIPASVVDFRPRADKSYKISFESRELTGKEVALLADSYRGEGWLLFSPNAEVQVGDVPEGYADAGVKSPAQRLRGKIYVLWRDKGAKGSFEAYYTASIEKLIGIIDDQLEDK